jgi:rfaE bifunctional protein nucleotidyltransferase chain/domain
MASKAPTKILSRDQMLALRQQARAQGRRVVQCHGCFDIVHPGHVRHLRFAKAQGEILLVTITGDQHVNKGLGRPLIPHELRAENLAELDCVDWVYVEPRPTASELLEEVRPDVYIKGREYEFNRDPRFAAERQAVEAHGGRVVFSSGDVVFSSTALIEAMEHESADPFHRRLNQLARDPDLAPGELTAAVDRFRGRRVVVVGEVMQDTYVFCDKPGLADESPMMTLRPIRHQYFDGGAAIIARHLAALGARPILVTAMPRGELSDLVRARLRSSGVDVRAVDTAGALTEKQRYLVGATKMVKLDLVEPLVLDARQRETLVDIARTAAREQPTDAAIVCDFGIGLFSPAMTTTLCRALRENVGILAGDVSGQRSNLRSLAELDVVCPAESQVRDAYRNYGDGLPAVTWKLLEETHAAAAIISMGAEGAIAFRRLPDAGQGRWESRLHGEHIPALAANPVDTLGCGDALLATATLMLAAGASLTAAAFAGSAAAAVHGRRLGNAPVESAELRRELLRVLNARLSFVAPDQPAAAHFAPPLRTAS